MPHPPLVFPPFFHGGWSCQSWPQWKPQFLLWGTFVFGSFELLSVDPKGTSGFLRSLCLGPCWWSPSSAAHPGRCILSEVSMSGQWRLEQQRRSWPLMRMDSALWLAKAFLIALVKPESAKVYFLLFSPFVSLSHVFPVLRPPGEEGSPQTGTPATD